MLVAVAERRFACLIETRAEVVAAIDDKIRTLTQFDQRIGDISKYLTSLLVRRIGRKTLQSRA